MAPKKSANGARPKGKAPPAKPKGPKNSIKARSNTARKSQPQGRKPRLQNAVRPAPLRTEWFPLVAASVSGSSKPGVLETVWLHPGFFPGTPYNLACTNYASRHEYSWEFRIYVTTATTTGMRLAAAILPTPLWTGSEVSAEVVWGLICNGRGTMITTSGTRNIGTKLRVRGTTALLSNTWPTETNKVGCTDGLLIVYCLQPPIGITEATSLQVQVMARVTLSQFNPCPNFMTLTPVPEPSPAPTPPAPTPHPSTAEFAICCYEDAMGQWEFSHTGDAWCAGGMYIGFMDDGANHSPKLAVQPQGNPNVIGMLGVPHANCVYAACDVNGRELSMPDWETAWGVRKRPQFFTIYWGPVSNANFIVGFADLPNAILQAEEKFDQIPRNAELCVRYSGHPRWAEAFPLSSVQWTTWQPEPDSCTSMPSNVHSKIIYFTRVHTGLNPLPIWKQGWAIKPDLATASLPPFQLGEGQAACPSLLRTHLPQLASMLTPTQQDHTYATCLPQQPTNLRPGVSVTHYLRTTPFSSVRDLTYSTGQTQSTPGFSMLPMSNAYQGMTSNMMTSQPFWRPSEQDNNNSTQTSSNLLVGSHRFLDGSQLEPLTTRLGRRSLRSRAFLNNSTDLLESVTTSKGRTHTSRRWLEPLRPSTSLSATQHPSVIKCSNRSCSLNCMHEISWRSCESVREPENPFDPGEIMEDPLQLSDDSQAESEEDDNCDDEPVPAASAEEEHLHQKPLREMKELLQSMRALLRSPEKALEEQN
nr:hypothetical protein 3 [Mute swan feces associated tombus-like virus 4]